LPVRSLSRDELKEVLLQSAIYCGVPAANHAFISGLQGAQSGGSGGAFDGALNDSSFIQQIDARLARPFLVGFSEAIDLVFLIGSGVMVVAFVVLWFLPNVELRSGSSYAERGRTDAADAEAATAPPAIAH